MLQPDARRAAQVRHQPPGRRHQHVHRAATMPVPWPKPWPRCHPRMPAALAGSAQQRRRRRCAGPASDLNPGSPVMSAAASAATGAAAAARPTRSPTAGARVGIP